MNSNNESKRLLLFYNHMSGNGIFKNNLDMIIEKCQDRGFTTVPVRVSTEYNALGRAFEHFDMSKFDRIIVAGGDGTVNTCVTEMIKHDIHLPLAILPAGTANDFAYYFDIPTDLDVGLAIALGDTTVPSDVCKANDKYFINVTAIGSIVDLSEKTDQGLKNALGMNAYYLKAISELAQFRPVPVKMTTPDKVYDEEVYFLFIMNGESCGGFRKMSPEASVEDGLMEVVAFLKMPFYEVLPVFIEMIAGNHPENKNVLYFQTPELLIESPEDVPTDIDGDHGTKLPMKFEVLNKRLDILVSRAFDPEE